ncbi:MAG: glycosyltransferase family 87 protein [Fibrobacteria bacterium]
MRGKAFPKHPAFEISDRATFYFPLGLRRGIAWPASLRASDPCGAVFLANNGRTASHLGGQTGIQTPLLADVPIRFGLMSDRPTVEKGTPPMNQWLLWSILVPAFLSLVYHYRAKFGLYAPYAIVIGCLVPALICLLYLVRVLYEQRVIPAEWDFLAFWTYGQAGASGQDFYKPANFAQIAFPISPSRDFTREVLNVGFPYPPPTMLLLLPLGWLALSHGYFLWYGIHFLALAVSIGLLWRIFLRGSGIQGLAFTAALVVLFPPLFATFHNAQTNLLALCALLAYWMHRNSFKGGAAMALGLAVKPYFAVLLLFPLMKRHLRAGIGFLTVSSFLSLLALLAFGGKVFLSYVTEKPTSKLPLSVFSENVNQSLSAFFLRMGAVPIGISPVFTLPNLLASAVLAGLTTWAVYRCSREDSDWALCLTLLMALIIYPGALFHYGVMALPAILLLWSRRAEVRGRQWTVALVIACVYGLAQVQFTLAGNLLLWMVAFWQSMGLPTRNK